MNSGSHLDPSSPCPDDLAPWYLDPGRWNVPSPLVVGAVASLTVAAAATWWCMGQLPQVGVAALLLVLFSELVVALGLIAARGRAVLWEYTARISKVESVLEGLRMIDSSCPDRQSGLNALTHQDGTELEAIRRDVALLHEQLAESVARARHDIEDGKILLVDSLGRDEHAAAARSESV